MIHKRNALRKAIEELKWGNAKQPTIEPEQGFMERERAFGGAYRRYRVNGRPIMDVDTFFNRIRGDLINLITRELTVLKSARVKTTTWIRLIKDDDRVELAINNRMTNVHQGSDLGQIVDEMIAHIKTQIENPALLNSRFRFDEVLLLDVNFHWLNLTRGSSYLPLPDWLARKKAIINTQNDDEECFEWAVIAALRWEDIKSHPEWIFNLREFSSDYDWSGLKFPISIKDINIFEMNNDISVNVLSVEDKDVYICRKGCKALWEINLMLISEGDKWHYTAIESLSRLLPSKNYKHAHKQYFCNNCLQGFTQELSRDEHYSYCINNEMVRVEMPSKGSTVEFYDGQNQFRVPFMMYADFEAILELIQEWVPDDPNEPYTSEVSRHIPSGWCVYSKFTYDEVETPLKLYRSKDCVEKFCNHIKQEAHSSLQNPMKNLN